MLLWAFSFNREYPNIPLNIIKAFENINYTNNYKETKTSIYDYPNKKKIIALTDKDCDIINIQNVYLPNEADQCQFLFRSKDMSRDTTLNKKSPMFYNVEENSMDRLSAYSNNCLQAMFYS